jgi:hypothetical protein
MPSDFRERMIEIAKRLAILERRGKELPLPSLESRTGPSNQLITATAWADMPGMTSIVFDIPRRMLVQLAYGAWMATATDVRYGALVSGATSVAENFPNWGAVPWMTGISTAQRYTQRAATKFVELEPGVNTIRARAYRTGTGSDSVNLAYLQAAPIRWL